jgi:uncharacterized protein YhbP (UPF0306 family)
VANFIKTLGFKLNLRTLEVYYNHCGFIANIFGVFDMQQAALVPFSKQHWCHAASSIGAMQQAALVPCSK